MAKNLIIVESPAKTKTLKGFLGKDYAVEASMGHVRDLPKSPISVDIENGFALTYTTIPDRKDVLGKLAAAAKGATTVYLASDPDREGEAIAWHIATALKLKPAQIKRIQFNEITKGAVQEALKNPRDINLGRVDAQQARRALDRLVGYKVSPILWAKVAKGTSAGRVQSVAVRIIVDREREIKAFVPQEYWTLTATLTPQNEKKPQAFDAGLTQFNGKKIELKTEDETNKVLTDLKGAIYTVAKVKKSERQRRPTAPFITSTIQQEAARKLGFSSKRTMSVAQQLYEGIDLGADGGQVGLITYMRTDSTRIAAEAQAEARQFILTSYGERYAPAKPNVYKTKGSAQDAHEAIRPTSTFREPDALKNKLSSDQYKLYRLIWLRFVASQMTPAILDVVAADINANAYTFRAAGSTIKFDGFLRVYSEGKDEATAPNKQTDADDEEKPPLPPLTEGQTLDLQKLLPKQHFTEPPPRFSEATLVKALEEQGIGRPSTYASIISTVQDRGYVELKEKRFYPTDLGFAVTDYLVKNFEKIMDVGFTADMEDRLDKIEEGEQDYVSLMKAFYDPFADTLKKADKESEKMVEQTDKICPDCGKPLIKRVSRFGAFYSCTGYPECKYRLDAKAEAGSADGEPAPAPVEFDIQCPNCGKNLVERMGRFGKFIACPGYPTCKYIHKEKPVSIGVKCPGCKIGELGEKKSRMGVFYPCNRYPECKFSLSGKPLPERPCPACGGLLHETGYRGRITGIKCANPECSYVEKFAGGKAGETAAAEADAA
ncbi:MAG: type I DNA topoisomerase [Fibrella sp.]|nr:type I DNA topoisomerase [Armatimonadota bacterium]